MAKKQTAMQGLSRFFHTPRARMIALCIGGVFGALIVIFLAMLLLVSPYTGKTGFRSLEQVTAYASRTPEHPPMDNTNLVRPDYSQFYATQQAGYIASKWQRIKALLHLKKEDDWTPGYFVELLQDSLLRFKNYGMEKNIVYRITPKKGTRFILWGDIQGAYHSVVRTLHELKKMGVIDEELKIIAPDTYLVFMGDVISRSSYGMQTLSLLQRLIQLNPEHTVYLRGNHEDKKYWYAFGLKAQMTFFLSSFAEKAFVPEVDDFFNRLPLGLYLPIPGEKHEFVRLSHLGHERDSSLLEERFSTFLHAAQKEPIDRLQFDKTIRESVPVKIEAIIRSEKKRETFQTMDGLRLLAPDEGATAWNMLSSPTKVSQDGLKFYHDAFAVLTVGERKEHWHITLHKQDARTLDGFTTRTHQFFSGKEMSVEDIEKITPAAPAAAEEAAVPVKNSEKPAEEKAVVAEKVAPENTETEDTKQSQAAPAEVPVAAPKRTEATVDAAKAETVLPSAPPSIPAPAPAAVASPQASVSKEPINQPAPSDVKQDTKQTPTSPAQPVTPSVPAIAATPTTAAVTAAPAVAQKMLPLIPAAPAAPAAPKEPGSTAVVAPATTVLPPLPPAPTSQPAAQSGKTPLSFAPTPNGPFVTINIVPAPGTTITMTTTNGTEVKADAGQSAK